MVAPFICRKCVLNFSTLTHLRRHVESQHLLKSYKCFFCSSSFRRKDTARRHANLCSSRCGRPLPKIEKGRPRASCDNCAWEKKVCNKEYPCSNCGNSSSSCTYTRVVPYAQAPPPRASSSNEEITRNTMSGNETENFVATSEKSETLSKVRIPFLLNYYDVDNTLLDMYPALQAGSTETSQPADIPSSLGHVEFMPSEILELFPEGIYNNVSQIWPNSTTEQSIYENRRSMFNKPPDPLTHQPFSQRSLEVAEVLRHFARGGTFEAPLEKAIEQNLFSPTNMRDFEHLYTQHSHKHCPILHLPTLNTLSATLPLLLAIFLGGSLHSYPRDTFQLAVDCFDMIEAYLFSLSVFQTGVKKGIPTPSEVESLQAAVILLHLQFGRNDSGIRRRIRQQRFPILLHVARSMSLFESRHDENPTLPGRCAWDPRSESLIRTATFILMLDTQFVVCLRSPPMTLISEFNGHLPCAEAVFCQAPSTTLVPIPRPSSLLEMIDFLLAGNLNVSSCHTPHVESIFGLFAVLSGLHLVLFSAFASRMIIRESVPLDLALTNWKILWRRLMSQVESEEVQMAGFMANANELWLVAKILLKTDIHDFSRGLESQSFKPFLNLLQRVDEFSDQ